MRPTVLLFDIDGTLLSSGGAGRRAFAQAFVARHDRSDAITFPLDGMTDRLIARLALEAIGKEPTDAEIEAVLRTYLGLLAAELSSLPKIGAAYRVYPGVRELLIAAGERPQTAVGLGTGNTLEGARLKLTQVDLFHCFSFGSYGSDHENRVELIRIGAGRGAEKLGLPIDRCRVVVIGDTPKDVDAGRAIGAECVGVGTGRFKPEELIAAGATRAYPTLAEPGAAEYVLSGAGR